MSSLEIQTQPVQGIERCVVVHLNGTLDQPTLEAFLSSLKSALGEGSTRCILDMQQVGYANSTALGALVTQADAFREAGGEFVLLNPQPKVNLVIEMLGLNAMFPIFSSMEEARAHFAAPSSRPAALGRGSEAAAGAAPAATASFPLRAECIGCGMLLEFSQPSRFRCPHCGSVYVVDDAGRVTGSRPRGGHPIELSLPCQPQALRALQSFIGALPAWPGYSDEERAGLEQAIGEICDAIHQKAYEGNGQATFHLLVVCRDDELAIRIADHGKPLDASAFPRAAAYMSEFEHRPHPARGNFLKMAKRPG